MQFQLVAAFVILGLFCSTTNADCGDPCANNNECHNSVCTRCVQGRCSIGLPCGAFCQVDTDCNANTTCSLCYFQHCGSRYCGSGCNSDAECGINPYCTKCIQHACNPPNNPPPAPVPVPVPVPAPVPVPVPVPVPPQPVPSPVPVPPSPSPAPIPPPTPPAGHGWGALGCSPGDCTSSNAAVFTAANKTQARDLVNLFCDGGCDIQTYFTDPNPCFALALGDGGWGWAARPDLGSAITNAILDCRKDVSNCYVVTQGCAVLPPPGARWGALACAGGGCSNGWGMTDNGVSYATREGAHRAALNWCEKSNSGCYVADDFYQCSALAVGSSGWSSQDGATYEEARAAAIRSCGIVTSGCKISYVSCTNSTLV